ncbi:MAG: UDP-N-acetylmuramoyl-tripeptide--D-alanyl-D-alanine ligase [Deltaproteobacteria bacterium]|nr:UDP-N-acetylmuramoyl-tripeptide--D-alanyl-D-alanine ligase [Deltaproteobacteria bacterium]
MPPFFTTADILSATRGNLVQGHADAAFAGVSTDSRTCQAGDLFIPLKGERHDGHEYVPKALDRGVRGVVVEEKWLFEGRTGGTQPPVSGPLPHTPKEVTLIAVPDTLAALGDLARAWRSRFSIPVVALTGSCGKTTAKEMTARVLSGAYRVLKNELNLNNLIGLPQTLLKLDAGYTAAVVEMGMNRFGEIQRLTAISQPAVGVLLNVYPAHTEGVGCVEGVACAKGELIAGLPSTSVLVYNADDPRVACRAGFFPGRTLSFGLGSGAALRARSRQSLGRGGQTALLTWQEKSWPLKLKAPGLHQLLNALAATAVGLLLGVAPEETAQALAEFQPVQRRSQIVTLPSGVHLMNDCYNANPGSMAMALRTLKELKDGGRAAAALGDMLELGAHAVAQHRELGKLAAALDLDLLVAYGNFKEHVAAGAAEGGLSKNRVIPVQDREEGVRVLKDFLRPGDWLLVKGSRSMHMECIVEALGG